MDIKNWTGGRDKYHKMDKCLFTKVASRVLVMSIDESGQGEGSEKVHCTWGKIGEVDRVYEDLKPERTLKLIHVIK